MQTMRDCWDSSEMRRVAWVVKGRRLAKRVVESCVICRKARAKKCKQIMSDLPPERIGPAAPFEFVTVDLFGPYEVKDEVKKRIRLKVWGDCILLYGFQGLSTQML